MKAKNNENLTKAVEFLVELEKDTTVPKNVQQKLTQLITNLSSDEEVKIKVSRVMQELIEMSEEANLQPFTRTQIYNIVSLLEVV